jgi:hypothetical protein
VKPPTRDIIAHRYRPGEAPDTGVGLPVSADRSRPPEPRKPGGFDFRKVLGMSHTTRPPVASRSLTTPTMPSLVPLLTLLSKTATQSDWVAVKRIRWPSSSTGNIFSSLLASVPLTGNASSWRQSFPQKPRQINWGNALLHEVFGRHFTNRKQEL